MDSQELPVVNTVTPVLPHIAQSGAVAPPDVEQEAPLLSSSKRSMTGQTNASFTTMLSRQTTASTDSLINSLVDSAPTTPTAKGKGKTSTTALESSASTPAVAALKPAPAGKSESAVSGIRRLDSNMAAMASRIESHITQFHEHAAEVKDDLNLVRSQVQSVVADTANVPNAFSAKDMLAHPTIRALIASNNSSSTIAEMRTADRKRKHDDDTTIYSEDVFLPAVKRVAHTHDIQTTVTSVQNDVPAAPAPISYVDLTANAGPVHVVPGAVPDAPAPISAAQHNAAGVDIGPIGWGKDISGQVRGLIARMPRGKNIDTDAVKAVYAKRFPKNNKFVTAFFPTNVAAIQFVNAWEAAPPAGYEKTSVSFASGN
ncbi:hypothetical protein B0H13DRAFT_2331321 [Mycena leptocephala]|nr:hypothetical protein B0H13DRAFT_2331321 [Mycena leptocephala]